MSLSTTLTEAKSSVDRLHDIVNKCYQETIARVQALESREFDRMSHAQLTAYDRDSIISNVPIDIVRESLLPELLSASGSSPLDLEYLEELQRSWVYRRNSAFRMSTFSTDRHSTTWSCLSGLSLSEVSNISILNLAITIEDVNNPQRLSQTWSNDQAGPRWPLLPNHPARSSMLLSRQYEEPQPNLPQSAPYDGETVSVVSVKRSTKDMEETPSAMISSSLALGETTELIHASEAGSLESQPDQDDDAYPCKGCGEVGSTWNTLSGATLSSNQNPKTDRFLVHRFYLKEKLLSSVSQHFPYTLSSNLNSDPAAAGTRWHIDCFRCKSCGTLLDSDANLLLLGDGSLICNNCTYSCSACGVKIEDLAILTADQAFCPECFKCRKCKRKIENLKYARTSQGRFCMVCHALLMVRRRKKWENKKREEAVVRTQDLDKALPSLPPSVMAYNK